MKRVLITGRHGFTGGYVADELLAHGWEVSGLGSSAASDDPLFRSVDLTDAAAVTRSVRDLRPQAVVHLAALAFVGHGHVEDFYRVNLIGTHNLLAALSELDVPPECVVLASSANIYGNRYSGALNENTPPDPVNDYAVSKLAMEHMASLWMDRLPIVIARPFNYTGVGQSSSFLLPKIVEHYRRRAEHIELGNLDVSRDFSDVRDVARAYRRLLELNPAGEVFNLCSGRTYTLRQVLDIAGRLSNHELDVRVNPAFVRANEVRTLSGDGSKFRALTGSWSPAPLDETLRWMLDQG